MEAYKHVIGEDFKHLPEVYQIEACSACNLQCPMCERTTHMGRQPGLLQLELLSLMQSRGDFGGSYYVELQMAGEPTLHPQLFQIIRYLKDVVGVMVGLSTHGLNMTSVNIANLLMLDALTISVDSTDPVLYHQMRFPAEFPDLLKNLEKFMGAVKARKAANQPIPFIEFQLIVTDMFKGTGDVQTLQNLVNQKFWGNLVSIRTTGDCFVEMQDRGTVKKRNDKLCLNPFRSVSIAHNGDVVSCCYIFDPKKETVNYYGNLYEQSLAEIWSGPRVKAMQDMHQFGPLKDQCAKCYLPSPCEIHTQILSRLIRTRR